MSRPENQEKSQLPAPWYAMRGENLQTTPSAGAQHPASAGLRSRFAAMLGLRLRPEGVLPGAWRAARSTAAQVSDDRVHGRSRVGTPEVCRLWPGHVTRRRGGHPASAGKVLRGGAHTARRLAPYKPVRAAIARHGAPSASALAARWLRPVAVAGR